MRHRRSSSILSRRTGQRKALFKNLTKNILIHQRIKTTLAKAKAVRSDIEKLITLAKEDSLHHRRLAYNLLQDHKLIVELFKEIAPLFKARNGGYTRIMHLNHRKGDNAQMVLLELVEQKVKKIPSKKEEAKKKVEEKVKPEHKVKEAIKTEEVKPKDEEVVKPQEKEAEKKPSAEKPKSFLSGIRKLFKGKDK